jgi:hypothetical protein
MRMMLEGKLLEKILQSFRQSADNLVLGKDAVVHPTLTRQFHLFRQEEDPRPGKQERNGRSFSAKLHLKELRSKAENGEKEALLAKHTYKEAMRRDDANEWKQAMKEEMKSLTAHDAWTLVQLPAGRKAITGR